MIKKYSATLKERNPGTPAAFWLARLQYVDPKTGKRVSCSKSASTKSEAKGKLEELIEQYIKGGKSNDHKNWTFKELADHCKEHHYCDAVYSSAGKLLLGVRNPKKHHSTINRLVSHLGHIKLENLSVANLEKYKKDRLTDGKEIATVNRELSTCRAMLKIAWRNDWIVRSPFDKAKGLIQIAHENKRDVTLTIEEEIKLLAACQENTRPHLYPLVLAGIDSGSRMGELLRLKWSDIDLQAGTMRVTSYKGKTMSIRPVPITDALKQSLKSLPSYKPLGDQDRSVFGVKDNFRKSWNSAREAAGLPHLHFNDLRHCALSSLAKGGMSLGLAGAIAGHRNPQTTLRYTNANSEVVDTARDILNKRRA